MTFLPPTMRSAPTINASTGAFFLMDSSRIAPSHRDYGATCLRSVFERTAPENRAAHAP
jgi:hypothetical protein